MVERDYIKLNESLKRLRSNKDFQALIEQGYFIDEVLEASEEFNDASFVNQGLRPYVLEKITGINMLKQYFTKVENLAASQELAEKENESI